MKLPAGVLDICQVCTHPSRAGESIGIVTREIPLDPFPPLRMGGPAHGDCARKDEHRPDLVVVERDAIGYPLKFERRWDA